jgi:hypothetical protein
VPLAEHVKFDEKGRHIRGTGRLNSRVPIAIEWTEEGKALRAEGFTKDISPKGCLAMIPHNVGVGQKLRIVNVLNQSSSEAILIWRGHEGPAGWELGLELQAPPGDFWGLDW